MSLKGNVPPPKKKRGLGRYPVEFVIYWYLFYFFLLRIQAENSKNFLYPRAEPPYKFLVLDYSTQIVNNSIR